VYFTDKGFHNRTELTEALRQAEAGLTLRARKRRERLEKHDLIEETDLPINSHYTEIISSLTGHQPRTKSRWLNAASYNLQPSQVKDVSNLSFVSQVEPVRSFIRELPDVSPVMEDEALELPCRDDHRFDYGGSYRQNAFINAPELHDRGYLGRGILIGITDTGFNNLDHNCFESLDIVAAWDFVNDDEDVADGDDIGEGEHGTWTLSIIAGFDPERLIGIAPEASYVLAKTESTEWERRVEEDYWIAAVEWMDSLGVDVISVSLSYMSWYDYEDLDGETSPITRVADRAVEAGIVVVVSMGNTGQNNYPRNKMGAPADGFGVFAVGATETDSSRSVYSSYGPTWDRRIKPDFTTMGSNVRVASDNRDNIYARGLGTSFSAPAISGLCALLIEANPYLTPLLLRDVLREASHNNADPDTAIGWGIPDGLAALEIIEPAMTVLSICLDQGWNMISHNLSFSEELTIPGAFEKLVENGNLILVRNAAGNFYFPAYNYNNIPVWDPYQGYMVNVYITDTLVLQGLSNDYFPPMLLREGWRMVAYLPGFALPAEAAFASLVEINALVIARDGKGDFYLPDENFNMMDDLVPGGGYQLRLRRDGELLYPHERIESVMHRVQPDPTMFPLPPVEPDGMSVLIYGEKGIINGDEIGFYGADGKLIGSGVFTDGRCGITIWGDETCDFPEALIYRRVQNDLVNVRMEWNKGPGEFIPGEVAVIRAELEDETLEAVNSPLQVDISPNPFNNLLRLDYSTIAQSIIELTVYDLLGRRMEERTLSATQSGNGSVIFNTSYWSAGCYIVQVKAAHEVRRLIVRHVK